jgi:4-hydroxy-tetrahydrodipicolinate reductase
MTKIAIIGYGKMGKAIKALAKEKGFEVVSIIDPKCEGCKSEISKESLGDVEVCIDFTHPNVIIENIKKMALAGKNMVIGTTGWYEHKNEVKKIVENAGVGLIWSGNFSIGVNAFFRILDKAAKIFNNLEDYGPLAYEMHHKNKADSPSGTANMMAEILLKNLDGKERAVYEMLDRPIEKDEIHIASVRGGSIPGVHEVQFDSSEDTISIKHTARNRNGFANGSLMAANFIKGKKGFYNIDDLMNAIIKK